MVDRFEGALADRMIAEVEATDAAALRAIHRPGWCGREITGEMALGGAALARDGWPAQG